ncbi:MAG: hypothetical protein ACLPYS_00365 [Vulcanimicrobiaceae bacterium]
MSDAQDPPATPAVTYSAQRPLAGPTLTCPRCRRVHPYPRPRGQPVYCECGWHYSNVDGRIIDQFSPRFGA